LVSLFFLPFHPLTTLKTSPGLEEGLLNSRNNANHPLSTCRYFPYWITTATLTILFIFIMLYLISQRQLLPGIVIMGSFILFVLWMVGLIVVSIELWGPTGSVNGNCNLYVNGQESSGVSVNTLAWLEQHSICEYTIFVFSLAY